MQLDDLGNKNPTWQKFESMFLSYYILEDYRLGKVNDFFELTQGNMSVAEYHVKLWIYPVMTLEQLSILKLELRSSFEDSNLDFGKL